MQQIAFYCNNFCIACSTCFGHYYAHHPELKSIIQMLAVCGIWCLGFQVVSLVWSCGLCVRFAGCCSILQTGHTYFEFFIFSCDKTVHI